MADCKKYAIFVWVNDDPVTGRVLKLSNVTHPRRDYEDYFEGQEVDAKCPGFGVNKAVIGKISDESGKKMLEDILNGREFKELVATLLKPPCQVAADVQEGIQDNTENETQQAMDLDEEDNSIKKKENKKTKVHRPKAVRKLVTGMDITEQPKSKELQLAAEDLALADLSSSQASQHLESTAQLITSSLELVGKTGMTPQKRKLPDPELDLVKAENARLANENKELAGRLSTVEWSLQYLWSEVTAMKVDISTRMSNTSALSSPAFTRSMSSSPANSCSSTSAFRGATQLVPEASDEALDAAIPACVPELNDPIQEPSCSKEPVYNGYVKSQIMEELGRSPNFRIGTGKCFKMLFTREEYEGRSLSGGKSNTGEKRLALEDKKKWDFLEDCVVEKWAC